jgi:hypothetical protein
MIEYMTRLKTCDDDPPSVRNRLPQEEPVNASIYADRNGRGWRRTRDVQL